MPIGPLVLALKDPSSGVRRISAAALSVIDEDWSSSPEARASFEQLKADLDNEGSDVRNFMGQLLMGLGAMELKERIQEVPKALATSAPEKKHKLGISLFIALLSDADRDFRQAAAEALGRLGGDRIQPALMRVLADPDPGVRSAAERALKSLSPKG